VKVQYIGATDAQVKWGDNDDPRGLLEFGEVYEVLDVKMHSFHTKITLKKFPALKFNDASFAYILRSPR
jgi:hypothetical protein